RPAVRVDFQALARLVFGDAASHAAIRELEGDEGHHGGPDEYQAHRFRLATELSHDSRVTALHRDPVLHGAGAAQVRRVEHAGEQRTEYPADCVNAEHVERIICTQHFLH